MSVFEIRLGIGNSRGFCRGKYVKFVIFPDVHRQIIAEAKIVVTTFMLNFRLEYKFFI